MRKVALSASTPRIREVLQERRWKHPQRCLQSTRGSADLCKAVEKSGEEVCDSGEVWRLRLHVVLTLLLVELTLFLGRGVLVLLVLRHQIVHVALRLREFHLVHALARVPVQEGLAAEHARELLGDTLEHFLDRRRVAY